MKKLLITTAVLFVFASSAHADAGQLPACDSAEVVTILARITNSTLNGILGPRTLGSGTGKNFCTAAIARWSAPFVNNQATYTVEWMDQAKGTYWVQITGRLAR